MTRMQIRLDTQSDVRKFVGLATHIESPVHLEDGTGYRANAKSLLGVMYGMAEFNNLYVVSEDDSIYNSFKEFAV